MTTFFTTPYAGLPPESKSLVHARISSDDHDVLFMKMFPRHGAQDRIIATILSAFLVACRRAGITDFPTTTDFHLRNEQIAAQLLSSVTFHANPNHTPSTAH